MPQKPKMAKYVIELNNAMNAIRAANERLIKLSQRMGRLIPKFQKIDHNTTGIFPWFNEYNAIKDSVNKADDTLQKGFNELLPLINSGELSFDFTTLFPLTDYSNQRTRYYSKIEVLDDILHGIWEDIIDGMAFNALQKEQMKKALDETMEKSKKKDIDIMFR